MDHERFLRLAMSVLTAAWLVACQPAAERGIELSGKIPITTDSEEARAAFVKGRELQENLRFTDARQHFLDAVANDDGFAWAHFGVAQTANTTTDFFSALGRATELADRASEGERLLIQSFAAAVNGEPERQRSLLQALVAEHPNDERAQNLKGLFHFGRQEWDQATKYLRKATEINPDFAPAYNQLGYALRFMGDFSGAEGAFQRYVELIPTEPNPYDSYAELLMKIGRFSESIEQYQKALEQDQNFIASYIGIGNNHMFMGEFEQAREAFEQLAAVARNDGERRARHFWRALSYLHQADHEAALQEIERQYDIAAGTDDFGAMSGDLNVMGDILLYSGKPDEALQKYRESVDMSGRSNATDEVKEAIRRNHVADLVRVALAKGDVDDAAAKASEYGGQVEVRELPFEVWQSHELVGLIALANQDYDTALEELEQANRQDARVMLTQAKALWGMGEDEAAREMCTRAAHFRTLNQAPFNYALVRHEALELLEG
jgi:tetratricopeptide (TPR) repeat protein